MEQPLTPEQNNTTTAIERFVISAMVTGEARTGSEIARMFQVAYLFGGLSSGVVEGAFRPSTAVAIATTTQWAKDAGFQNEHQYAQLAILATHIISNAAENDKPKLKALLETLARKV